MTTKDIANSFIYALKRDFIKNPGHNHFSFDIRTNFLDQLKEDFDEQLFKKMICDEFNCKLKIEKHACSYFVKGNLETFDTKEEQFDIIRAM